MITVPDQLPTFIVTDDGCTLELRHFQGHTAQKPVLLVHGASAGSDTFRIGEEEPLITRLVNEGFDVWTLDWRASKRRAKEIYCEVVQKLPAAQPPPKGSPPQKPSSEQIFTIDSAARYDVPKALEELGKIYGATKIGLVGHCLGGGIVAQGIAGGFIPADRADRVVLSALGLFYRAAIDNVLKAEDRILEQLFRQGQFLLHPTPEEWSANVCAGAKGSKSWDPLLEVPYQVWKGTAMRHQGCRSEFCARLCFMFGMPYLPSKIPTVHKHLEEQFGFVPMQFLLHCTENIRRGHAATLNASKTDIATLDASNFEKLARLTLLTGDLNTLWHRDSIDQMYEWLARGKGQRTKARWLGKTVFRGYCHQDLLWGLGAPKDVFPAIVAGLEPGP